MVGLVMRSVVDTMMGDCESRKSWVSWELSTENTARFNTGRSEFGVGRNLEKLILLVHLHLELD